MKTIRTMFNRSELISGIEEIGATDEGGDTENARASLLRTPDFSRAMGLRDPTPPRTSFLPRAPGSARTLSERDAGLDRMSRRRRVKLKPRQPGTRSVSGDMKGSCDGCPILNKIDLLPYVPSMSIDASAMRARSIRRLKCFKSRCSRATEWTSGIRSCAKEGAVVELER